MSHSRARKRAKYKMPEWAKLDPNPRGFEWWSFGQDRVAIHYKRKWRSEGDYRKLAYFELQKREVAK